MEQYITLAEAALLFPTNPAASTIWRWCARGVCVNDAVIRMKFVRIGRKLFTTANWAEEFVHRLTAETMASHEAWMNRHKKLDRSRQRQLAEADEILKRAGI